MKLTPSDEEILLSLLALITFLGVILVIGMVLRCQKRRKKPSRRRMRKMSRQAEKKLSETNLLVNTLTMAKETLLSKELSEEGPVMRRDSMEEKKEQLDEPLVKDLRYEVTVESYGDESFSRYGSRYASADKSKRMTDIDFVRDIDKQSYVKEQLKSIKREGKLGYEDELKKRNVVVFV